MMSSMSKKKSKIPMTKNDFNSVSCLIDALISVRLVIKTLSKRNISNREKT